MRTIFFILSILLSTASLAKYPPWTIQLNSTTGFSNYRLNNFQDFDLSTRKLNSITVLSVGYDIIYPLSVDASIGYFNSGDELRRTNGMHFCNSNHTIVVQDGVLKRNSNYLMSEIGVKWDLFYFRPLELVTMTFYLRPSYYYAHKLNQSNELYNGSNLIEQNNIEDWSTKNDHGATFTIGTLFHINWSWYLNLGWKTQYGLKDINSEHYENVCGLNNTHSSYKTFSSGLTLGVTYRIGMAKVQQAKKDN